MNQTSHSTTQFLLAAQHGDSQAIEKLFPIVYEELRTIAHRHLDDNQLAKELSSTDLVHEVYLKLIDQSKVNLNSRTHFFALSSRIMRQLLVDRARHNLSARRGGRVNHLSWDDETLTRSDDSHVLAVESVLGKLDELDPGQAKIFEMRFYGGMTVAEVADY